MRYTTFINEDLVKRGKEWCLVSKETRRPLKCWDYEPTKEEVDKEERRVRYFAAQK